MRKQRLQRKSSRERSLSRYRVPMAHRGDRKGLYMYQEAYIEELIRQ